MPQNISPGSLGLIALIGISITIFFCLTLYNTLNLIKAENRRINPVTVWLLFIPGFNMIWNFFVVSGITSSLREELLSRNYEVTEKPAFISGLGYSIISLLAVFPYFIKIPEDWFWALGTVGLLQLIFFVQYWIKVNWYKNILKNDNTGEEK